MVLVSIADGLWIKIGSIGHICKYHTDIVGIISYRIVGTSKSCNTYLYQMIFYRRFDWKYWDGRTLSLHEHCKTIGTVDVSLQFWFLTLIPFPVSLAVASVRIFCILELPSSGAYFHKYCHQLQVSATLHSTRMEGENRKDYR